MSDRPPTRSSRLSRGMTADQQFWQLWRHGSRPDLAAFLAARPNLKSSEVAAVVAIDQYERWLGGDRVPAEQYVPFLTTDAEHDQAQCDIVYGEYLLREQLGEHPCLDEFRQRFPSVGDLLARQVDLHQALADVESKDEPGISASAPRRSIPIPADASTAPQVPGFILGEVIGKGGMGVVYKARQVSLNRDVALKILPVPPGSDPTVLDRMRREAQITAQLSHPNIVTVFDAGLLGSWFYLAMEFVPGIDLHHLVQQRGPLPIRWACDYVRQAALGLQHAHDQGLVHRDIKPSNLIVSPVPDAADEATPGTVKILDLGLARISAESEGGEAPITQVGAFMGTPDFIAPEQASDPHQADPRSDLYSLGCTLYFLLTGQPPFSGATPLAKLMQHHVQDAPSIDQVRPEVPPEITAIVRRLLAKRPEDRFERAADLGMALAAIASRSSTEPAAVPAKEPVPQRPAPAPPEARVAKVLVGHTDWVKAVAFTADSQWLASGSLDGTVRLWHAETGQEAWKSLEHTASVLCVACSDDGRWLTSMAQDRFLCLYDVPARRLVWKVPGHERNVDRLAFLPSGGGLLSAGHDGMLRHWELATGRLTRAWQVHAGPVWGLATLPHGKTVLSGGQDRALRLWDVLTGEAVGFLPEQGMAVTCVDVSTDGQFALSGGLDGQIQVWDLPGRRLLRTLAGHPGRVTDVALSPDGTTAVSSSRDQTLRLWDVSSGAAGEVLNGHTAWVTSVAWSPDGRWIASGSVDRRVCVWRLIDEAR